MKHTNLTLAMLASACLAPSLASAATIDVSLLHVESDVVNTGGALVSASNFGTLPSPSLTVNGIVHVTGTANDTNLTYTPGFEGDFRNGETGYGVDENKVQELFSGIAGSNGMTLAIGGLDIGKEYLFQAYWDHNLSGLTLNMDIEGDTLSGVASQGDKNTPALYGGTLISYQFIAGDNTLNAIFDLDQDGAGNNWLSGYSLQEVVPEPSSTALLGLGGLALMLRRRRA